MHAELGGILTGGIERMLRLFRRRFGALLPVGPVRTQLYNPPLTTFRRPGDMPRIEVKP